LQLTKHFSDINSIKPIELIIYCSEAICQEQDIDTGHQLLADLIDQVLEIKRVYETPLERWFEFHQLLYTTWSFSIDESDYFSVPSNSLFHFMQDRIGNNALSAVLVEYLLGLLELTPKMVNFPGPFMIRIDGLDGRFIDPLNGEEVSRQFMELLVRGHLGDHMRLEDEHLALADAKTVKRRFLTSVKQASLLEEEYDLALMFTELLLELLPDDPNQIMERGFILQQLDYYSGAADDFAYFIEQCPDDPNSEVLKTHVSKLKTQQVVMH